MLHRLSLVVAALAAALLVVPAALALKAHVRVEGKERTIFGSTAPLIDVTSPRAGALPENALDALESASALGEFYYHLTTTSFGPYVDQVGLYGGDASSGWVFKVDDVSPPVGADQVQLKDGDRVLWYFATFGPTGGPPTLRVQAATKKGCYTATAFDDTGKPVLAANLVWHVGSKKSVPAMAGAAFCPGRHTGLLIRATATGAVRSNAVA